ncbi:hypothetical protein [Streptomyces sp. NBC_00989]|uniref:hypothetical protein n=1 Tax=Streptomyces sp. NBC_00989 TaxID=2903705 RepID=UPI0038638BFF|nr:hypothetical protein OG714_00090 [Streptomyces sp. NBC_00989]WSW98150.1 hypothetical protein OG714_54050 [Streptomyces sp. NBC_00989]
MRRLTKEEKTAILKDVGTGLSLNGSLGRLDVYGHLFYDERRLNPGFEAALMAAAHRGGNQDIQPIRTAAARIEEKRVKRAVLDALQAGGTLALAYRQVGVTDRTVRRLRMDDAQFDAVVGKILDSRKIDTERVKQAVLEALRAGHPRAKAYRQAGTCRRTVHRLRAEDPQFDRAVTESLHEVLDRILRGEHTVPRMPTTTGPRLLEGCTVAGCPDTNIKAKGLCIRHYYQQYRTGQTTPGPQTYGRTTCTMPGCGRPHRAKGYCTRCYERHVRQRLRARNGN